MKDWVTLINFQLKGTRWKIYLDDLVDEFDSRHDNRRIKLHWGDDDSVGFRGGAGPHHVHVFSHMYDMTVPLTHFYQRGKFVCRHLNYRSSSGQYFSCILFDIVTKQLLHLLFPGKSVRYLNLANARSSHVERISLSLYSLLVDFASTLPRFAQVAYRTVARKFSIWGFAVLRGGLCAWGFDIIKLTKIPFIVFHVSIWGGLGALFGGLSPPVARGLVAYE